MPDEISQRLMFWIVLVLSLSVHEWAHAFTAWRLGDDTAQRMGRLTMNPMAHIDPIGTVLLPLLGVPFGWAKPVPINPLRFRRDVNLRVGVMWTAAAGPLSNVALAVLLTGVYSGLLVFAPTVLQNVASLNNMLIWAIVLNALLALFNSLPVPPLDGSRVVEGLLPDRLRAPWDRFAGLGFIPLLALLILPRLLGVSLFAYPVSLVMGGLESLTRSLS